MADDIQSLFTDAGYTYPGTPEGGARLLLAIVRDAQEEAKAERTKYARLVMGLTDALDQSPLHQTPGDPLQHVVLLCERLQEGQVASITNIIATLRTRHPELSKRHQGDDHAFLADLDDLTDPTLAQRFMPLAETSVAYWQALQRGDDHATIASALTKWSQAVSAHLDPEVFGPKE